MRLSERFASPPGREGGAWSKTSQRQHYSCKQPKAGCERHAKEHKSDAD
jgi:hypothetical protein